MTEARDTATVETWISPERPVVVGVDGSDGSRAAVTWAAHEAGSVCSDLRIVSAAGAHHRFRLGSHKAKEAVDALADEVTDLVPRDRIATAVYDEVPETALLDHLGDARLLVVGKRGLGTLGRLLVGSVSLAVAGRCPVPVAVVPTHWDGTAHEHQPIVLGVEPDEPHHHLLHLAFRRAERLDAPLVAVHGWEPPSVHGSDEDLLAAEAAAHQRFRDCLVPWRERFPSVDLQAREFSQHPALAVLEEAEKGAQLVLLGRHLGNRFAGFGFGSVTRAVLHYSDTPVLVIPTDLDKE